MWFLANGTTTARKSVTRSRDSNPMQLLGRLIEAGRIPTNVAVTSRFNLDGRLELSLGEVTGALGDSVTVLPIVVALGTLTPLSIGHVFLFFGLFQIVWGVRYGLPLSVEPMKALAGLAIAGALSYGELVAAGLLAGTVLMVVGATGTLGYVERYVGQPRRATRRRTFARGSRPRPLAGAAVGGCRRRCDRRRHRCCRVLAVRRAG